jgi:hypothetical protein
MPYIRIKGKCCFISCLVFITFPVFKKINNRGLKFDYPRTNLFLKGTDRSSSENILHILQKILYL